MINKIIEEKALGLVEAVVAIGIIGSAMVVITNVAMGTIKRARKVELEDVAVQAAVEAMDYLKIPSEIDIYIGEGNCDIENVSGYAYLDFNSGSLAMPDVVGVSGGSEISPSNLSPQYKNEFLEQEGYEVYQQIYLESQGTRRYRLVSKVVWRSVEDEYLEKTLPGYRYGKLNKMSDKGECPN